MTALVAVQSPPPPSTSLPIRLDGATATLILRLPPAVLAETCLVRTLQTGDFGGLGDQITPPLGSGNQITLATGRDDKPAKTLKAVVWCPGYGVSLIDQPALDKSSGEITLALERLPNIELRAKVLPAPDARNLTGLRARVYYSAPWICGFFNLQDCGVPAWMVAEPRIGIDGALQFEVPDFANDRGIQRVLKDSTWFPWGPGSFRLDVIPDRPPHTVYMLHAGGDARTAFGEIAVTNKYPVLIMLRPTVR
jgi:hypothetical protein